MMEILLPGLSSTIQDLGRTHVGHMGVSKAGALNPLALKLANRLVDNFDNAAVLEIIMPPASFLFKQHCWIALTGSECKVLLDDEPIWFGWRVKVKPGQVLKMTPLSHTGLCSYLAVSGGFDIPSIMDSKSADMKNGFGGHNQTGMPFKKGEVLRINTPVRVASKKIGIKLPEWTNKIRVLKGPEYEQFSPAAQQQFWQTDWRIGTSSNRMGFRLEGEIPLERIVNTDMLSQAAFAGVIQVPPNGQPIVLAAEAQSTGGYPRIGVVIQADLWKFGQLQIGKTLQFVNVTEDQAKEALIQQELYLKTIERAIISAR